MALLAFYAGLVLGAAAGITITALMVAARTRDRPPPPPVLEDWGPLADLTGNQKPKTENGD